MNSGIRSKLDTGDRAYAFCLAHPTDDPTQTGLVTRLGDRLTRAHELVKQERAGHLTVHASVDTKDDIRDLIRRDMLVLQGIAHVMALDEPGVDARFEVPASKVSHQVFLGAAQTILEQVVPRREEFLAHGMPSRMLEDLTKLVEQYVDAIEEKHSGISAHVGANAELEKVVGEIIEIVRLLDRIHDVRYHKNAELLAAWKSAKEVVGPARPAEEDGEEPAGPEAPGSAEEPAA